MEKCWEKIETSKMFAHDSNMYLKTQELNNLEWIYIYIHSNVSNSAQKTKLNNN